MCYFNGDKRTRVTPDQEAKLSKVDRRRKRRNQEDRTIE